jgi:phenylalanine-4-hydroxylase
MGGAAAKSADWTVPQGWDRYTADEHRTWLQLFDRQEAQIRGRACEPYERGLHALDLRSDGIPDFGRLSEKLKAMTGWSVVAVPGLVPDDVFFDHLANRRFPAGNFIRDPQHLDYLEEPDVFHDVFGHVPMLTDPTFADYLAAYGRGGQRALELGGLKYLARLYWYTVEFGLVKTAKGLRIFGAGILSSNAETPYALESPEPRRLGFSLERTMATPYEIDHLQRLYFVTPSLEHLLYVTLNIDFAPIYRRLALQEDHPIDGVLADDIVFDLKGERQ